MKKIELLAPAGDLEKLKTAIDYGADAVYFGGKTGSLRASAGNLSTEEIYDAVEYCHELGKKAYLTVNIFAHNEDLGGLKKFINKIKDASIDAFIVSDPAVMEMIKSIIPEAQLHMSTQSNVTSYESANFWFKQGIKRIILARELTLDEIKEIRNKISEQMELEVFVHGAMCISYSGRCLLSNYMADRDGNRGECAQPCRWNYSLTEELRPGEYFPIEEDNKGTYILSSKDLCMIKHIPQLVKSGIISAKIEGRMKSSYYVATVVRAYRMAIDEYYKDPDKYTFRQNLWDELLKTSHRDFYTGFFFHNVNEYNLDYLSERGYKRGMTFLGIVKDYNPITGLAEVEQRNKFVKGDSIEIFGPKIDFVTQIVNELYDSDMNPVISAPHAQQTVFLKVEYPVESGMMLRK